MRELYKLEVKKEKERKPEEYMVCIVIFDNETRNFRGFANKVTQVSFNAKIYVSGFFDRKMNRLTLLEVGKGKFKKPTLYIFKNINETGDFRIYDNEYRFMYSKPTGRASIKIEEILEEEKAVNLEKDISDFLAVIDSQKDIDAKRVGGINLSEIEAHLKYCNYFL